MDKNYLVLLPSDTSSQRLCKKWTTVPLLCAVVHFCTAQSRILCHFVDRPAQTNVRKKQMCTNSNSWL